MAASRHSGRGILRGSSLHSIASPHEDSPTLNYHQQLYPYMYKEQKPKPARGSLGTHVAAWMATNGPATAEDIAKATGVSAFVLKEYLRLGKIPGAVEVGTQRQGDWRPRKVWGINNGVS